MADNLDDLFGLDPIDSKTENKPEKDEETRDEREVPEDRAEDGLDRDDKQSEYREDGEHEEPVARDREEPARDEAAPDRDTSHDETGEEPKEEAPRDGDDREKALLKEIARLRGQLASKPPTAPPPGSTTAPPLGPVPVIVSEDGTKVYVDPRSMQEQIRRIAYEEAVRLNTPTPEQVRQMQVEKAGQEYLAKNPQAEAAVLRAKRADEFLTAHIATLKQQGHEYGTFSDVIQHMRVLGIEDQFYNYFPEIKEIGIDDFVEAMASGLPSSRRLLYDKMTAAISPSRPKGKPPKRNGAPRELGNQPKSLTRKGGGRATAASGSDEAELKALEAEFQENVAKFPDSKYKRMQSLGRKLGVEGY